MDKKTDILICGGGASGLAAAITAKKLAPDLQICLVERNHRVGKKLLVTGNGRCNLGNIQEDVISNYHGTQTKYLADVFANTLDAAAFFEQMGLFCRCDTEGRLYPYSNQASTVLDTLRLTAEQLSIEMICNCVVTDLKKQSNWFQVQTSCGKVFAKAVLITTGGYAAPQTGSDGSAFSWLCALGHSCIMPKPALVSFCTDVNFVRPLKGVRIRAEVQALAEDKTVLEKEVGEVQFTENSLSGICVMNLSAKCCSIDPSYLSLHLFPGEKIEQIIEKLWLCYAARMEWKLEDFLTGLFPKKVAAQLLLHSGITQPLDAPVHVLTSIEIDKIASLCQNWMFPILSRGRWQNAQVTSGGISAVETDQFLQSKQVKGLFFAGEVLDLHGDCGGYNLNWAWRSGQYAAKNAVSYCQKRWK